MVEVVLLVLLVALVVVLVAVTVADVARLLVATPSSALVVGVVLSVLAFQAFHMQSAIPAHELLPHWREACKNNTVQRVKELQEMYIIGALDTRLMQVVKVMDKEFKPTHISWVNKPNTEVNVDLDATRSSGAQYDSLQANSLKINLDLFLFELKQEAAKHSNFRAESDRWDNEFNEDTRRNLELVHDMRSGAV